MIDAPGDHLGGCTLESEVGSGGMASVWRATSGPGVPGVGEGEAVAIKIVHPHLYGVEGFYDRFLLEANLGMRIRHPNVVRTLDAGEGTLHGETRYYLVMEYVEGQTLRQLLDEGGPLSERLCRHIGVEVARALQAIHDADVIHRDLKPENVLILENEVIKVMDLGVARMKDAALRLSATGQFRGTLANAAPEQIRSGGRDIDGRADLYSLGMLLYELVTGENPFVATEALQVIRLQLEERPRPPSVLRPQISSFLEEVILKLMEKQREDRFARADDVRNVLEQGEDSDWWSARSATIRAETHRPPRRMRLPNPTALFGRDDEVQSLRSRWADVRRGKGQTLLVVGEAGIGKSRLVEEFAATLEREGEAFHYVHASYPPGGTAYSSRAILDGYRDHFGDARLRARLTELLPGVPELVAAFASLLVGAPPPTAAGWFDRDAVITLLVKLNRALAEERPTLVVVDDLHFASEESRGVFAALAHAAADARVLLVGTARPELPSGYVADLVRQPHSTKLVLERLSATDVTRLVSEALGSDTTAEEIGALVAECSDGIPYFVFEYLAELKRQAALSQRPGGAWGTVTSLQALPRPRSLRDLERARIAGLSELDRGLLEAASCCGMEFDPLLATRALGVGKIQGLKQFGLIERNHRLVRSLGRNFRFDHHQNQQTLYDEIPAPLREAYHAALGEALLEQSADAGLGIEASERAAAIALHFLKGRQGAKARPWVMAAIEHCKNRHTNRRAEELASLALSVPGAVEGCDRAELLLEHARLMHLLGQRDALASTLEEAIRAFDDAGAPLGRVEAMRSLGRVLWESGRGEEAIAMLEEAGRIADQEGDGAARSSILGDLGNVLAHLGRYDQAKAHYERRLALARESGDRADEAAAIGSLGLTAFELGDSASARELLRQALPLFKEAGDLRAEAITVLNLGIAELDAGRFEAAKAAFLQHIQLARRIGYRRGEANGLGNLGLALQAQGQYAAALEHFERDLRIQRETKDTLNEGHAHQFLGDLLLSMGALRRAREHLDASRQAFADLGFRWGLTATLEHLARLERNAGDPDEADRLLDEAEAISREIGKESTLCVVLRERGLVKADRGHGQEALALFDASCDIARRLASWSDLVLGLAARARVTGDAEHARDVFEEHRGSLNATTQIATLMRLWEAQGRREELEAAHRALLALRDQSPPEFRESILARNRLHSRICAAIHAEGGSNEQP